MCDHKDWMKICVLCGDVLETTENKSDTIASSETSKTVYVPAQQSVQADRICSCAIQMPQTYHVSRCVACGGKIPPRGQRKPSN